MRARARVLFRETGLLRGEWRIIEPAALRSGGRGRILSVVNQQLISSGRGNTQLFSPQLPSAQPGPYLVAFYADSLPVGQQPPTLRYFVLREEPQADNIFRPVEMTAMAPQDGETLKRETLFRWQPLAGAAAYQISVYQEGDREPLTGKLIPGDESQLQLSDMTLANLTNGSRYRWQVTAISHDGQVIGRSELRGIVYR